MKEKDIKYSDEWHVCGDDVEGLMIINPSGRLSVVVGWPLNTNYTIIITNFF